MKNIKKTAPPASYTEWCNAQKRLGVNFNYKNLQNPEKEELHEKLIDEQGYICGYTMKRIGLNSSHIEHIKPRHICVEEGEGLDLDYFNLIACFPREGMHKKCRFGAQLKDKWWEDNGNLFISPINLICESSFVYSINGKISPADPQSQSASKTIKILKLDDDQLTNDRYLAINTFLYGEDGTEPLDLEVAKKAIGNIFDRNVDDMFYEFCITIRDALKEYIDILSKLN